MKHRWLRGLALRFLYPLLMIYGLIKKEKKEKLQRFIINLNNKLVIAENKKAKKILLLLPHCLQIDECPIRLTHNIHNCKGCGKCEIKELIKIADENKLDIFVATGGTLARRIVKSIMPEAIVAVACESDMSSGIADIYPLPVIGVINERPFGPCINTKVDLEKIKQAIRFFSQDQ